MFTVSLFVSYFFSVVFCLVAGNSIPLIISRLNNTFFQDHLLSYFVNYAQKTLLEDLRKSMDVRIQSWGLLTAIPCV